MQRRFSGSQKALGIIANHDISERVAELKQDIAKVGGQASGYGWVSVIQTWGRAKPISFNTSFGQLDMGIVPYQAYGPTQREGASMKNYIKIAIQLILAAATFLLVQFFEKVLDTSEILDPVSNKVGTWLKTTVHAEQLEGILIIVVLFSLNAIVFWKFWRKQKGDDMTKKKIDTPPPTSNRSTMTGIFVGGSGAVEVTGNRVTGADRGIVSVGSGARKISDNEVTGKDS